VDDKSILGSHQPRDLPATDIALIYKLRWDIEKFFGWWKQHLNVYPLIARSPYGFMVQRCLADSLPISCCHLLS